MRALRNRAFLALWIGLLVSSIGDWINYVAMVALVYARTGSATTLAGLRLMHIIPILLVAPFAGVFVDRWRRKWTLAASPLVGGASIAVLALYHPVWMVFLAYGAITIASTFFNPARSAILPDIVDDADLVAANSLSQITQTASILAGGVAGGLIVTSAGPTAAFWLDAASFLAVAGLVATIPVAERRLSLTGASLRREIAEGAGYLRHEPIVGAVVVAGALFVFAPATVLTLGVAFAGGVLHGGSAGYGELLAGLGTGSVLGAVWVIRFRRGLREDRAFALSGIGLGVAVTALGLSRAVVPAAIAYAAAGFASMINTVAGVTLIQRLVPERVRGRIFAVSSTFDHLGAFGSTIGIGIGAGLLDAGGLIAGSGVVAAAAGVGSLILVRPAGKPARVR